MSWRSFRPILRKLQTVRAINGARSAPEIHGSRSLHSFCPSSSSRELLAYPTSRSAYRMSAHLTPVASYATQQQTQDKGISTQEEDPFDSITDKIPERPVTVAEGASYGLIILAGLAVAAAAAYAVFKELVFQPKEYKIFGKALDRVQHDSQVTLRIGTPVTGYGQESRHRAARQRISNRVWKDEDGVERIEIMFFIRGPQGSGKVYTEMFKDKLDRTWKFTYLIVDVFAPTPARIMLESYVPAL
ncbi:probable mitochondrial import inner membrane translocase subunit TIM21 isoform X2 [Selaginella moellendorffii]|uniref:probable mitochondrial import inner membrane translocase subunit TIM21 isoform X2 n=1 Tax=Selaginella moellendorffii TaxID=88036 RepID=UPI000D1CCCF2|nr:probable mitochondrial import inner membrane translocase subunit TIM21 isoform X2 [Selaginella moellendorffii]XP_024515067.1 probable mitochondrial import inner membrane translocase subunit TIM21 isoform X2 [Selaginella moellendorffii]XP_024540563.1 probable mitochondrial import inner membrane translocase subunit TIM21 isoform X2 [Selaginella moellendorffii]|eukprot:XP_002979780.2 probable mitochondrial import inner membrane translocase subunit TIM21 isoform X2 [Selaginella moellendorffii]